MTDRLIDPRSPFAGTARYYDRFRAPYAPAAIDFIAKAYDLHPAARALDLGCGPGTIAIPLAHRVAEVVAVDPDEDMITEGRRLALSQGVANIEWLQATAEDLPLDLGPFQVATLGQSFHWMDRDTVLRKLALLIPDGGGLALVNGGRRRPQESWEPLAHQVVERFLGPRTRLQKANAEEPEHEPALRRSAHFSEFSAHEFPSAITRDIRSIIGCIYSISSSVLPLFGDDAEAFEAELTEALLSLNPTGVFNESVETEVIIARKGAG